MEVSFEYSSLLLGRCAAMHIARLAGLRRDHQKNVM